MKVYLWCKWVTQAFSTIFYKWIVITTKMSLFRMHNLILRFSQVTQFEGNHSTSLHYFAKLWKRLFSMFDNRINGFFKLCPNKTLLLFATKKEEEVILKMAGMKLQWEIEIQSHIKYRDISMLYILKLRI